MQRSASESGAVAVVVRHGAAMHDLGAAASSSALATRSARPAAGPSIVARAAEWLLPWSARLLHGGYFRRGLDRRTCRAIHRAAADGTLYRFAPPPPLTLAARRRGALRADEYRFRSPFVSHLAERNDAHVRHYAAAGRQRLVVLNLGGGTSRRLLEHGFVRPLLAAGIDVAVPIVPGLERRRSPGDRRDGWAATVGAALSAIVQLVHDDVALEAWARARGYTAIVVTGLGIGGTVTALLAATTARFDAYVPMLAGAHPGRLWMPPRTLARAVARAAVARAGVHGPRMLARLFDPVAPVRLPAPRRADRCTVVGLRYDTLVPPADVADLAEHWGRVPVWLPRCHVELPRCTAELSTLLARIVWTV
jgi:hypothetical protein